MVMQAAGDLCDGRLTLVHEGGYSEVHVPFCGHATMLEVLWGSSITAEDPLTAPDHARSSRASGSSAYCSVLIAEMEEALGY
jgi:acetoin utilization deacetylase AcuC-like enzyme